MKHTIPHSIRCLKAIEAYEGGRDEVAEKLGLKRGAIDRWVREKKIAPGAVLKLSKMFNEKVSVEELLGSND